MSPTIPMSTGEPERHRASDGCYYTSLASKIRAEVRRAVQRAHDAREARDALNLVNEHCGPQMDGYSWSPRGLDAHARTMATEADLWNRELSTELQRMSDAADAERERELERLRVAADREQAQEDRQREEDARRASVARLTLHKHGIPVYNGSAEASLSDDDAQAIYEAIAVDVEDRS
jgi:hypothetical protein